MQISIHPYKTITPTIPTIIIFHVEIVSHFAFQNWSPTLHLSLTRYNSYWTQPPAIIQQTICQRSNTPTLL